MNYLKELNAFYDRLETNPLSPSGITLWHALMHINNKTGWIEEFAVAASVLCIKSGLKDSMFKKARNELFQKGYIQFKSRNGNQSAIYKMVSLQSYSDHSSSRNSDHSSSGNSDGSGIPLFKPNESKPNNNLLPPRAGESSNPFILFEEEEIGKLTNSVREMMNDWLDGGYADEPEQLLCYAIREAAFNEKRSTAYVNGVLKRYIQQGIRTVAQLEQSEIDFSAKKNEKVTPFPGGGAHERNSQGHSRGRDAKYRETAGKLSL